MRDVRVQVQTAMANLERVGLFSKYASACRPYDLGPSGSPHVGFLYRHTNVRIVNLENIELRNLINVT